MLELLYAICALTIVGVFWCVIVRVNDYRKGNRPQAKEAIRNYSKAMTEKLHEPRCVLKGPWSRHKLEYLLKRVKEEMAELEEAIEELLEASPEDIDEKAEALQGEAVDVGLFSMMIYDNIDGRIK